MKVRNDRLLSGELLKDEAWALLPLYFADISTDKANMHLKLEDTFVHG